MFQNARVIRFIPDQAGRGGSVTAPSTLSKVDGVRAVTNALVVMGRWRTPAQPTSGNGYGNAAAITGGVAQGSTTLCMNNFQTYNTANAAAGVTQHLLSHWETSSNGHNIVDHNTNTWVANGFSSPESFIPATFVNVKNRCFICWAGTPTTIKPPGANRQSNNIIYDPTNPTSTATIYDIGVNAPATAATYTLAGSASGTTTVTNGSNCVNNATASGNWSSSTKAITLGGVPYYVISPSGYVTSFTTGGSPAGTSGTTTVTITGFVFPANGDWDGLTINDTDNAKSYVIQSYATAAGNTTVTTTVNLTHNWGVHYTVTGEQLQMTTAYQAGTTVPPLTESYTAYSGALSWSSLNNTISGPQYAYAYYDPYTGHISNVSPVLQITEQNQPGVNVQLSNIQPSAASDQWRFTEILIFRSLSSQGGIAGGILYPLGDSSGNFISLANTPGAKSYLDQIPDSQLLVNGGLQANYTTNNPPPGRLAHMALWDGRVWVNPVSDPTAVYFSADNVQVTFGVPEECFPSSNLLRIPAKDGRVLGMKLVGSVLVVTTQRWAYYVIGGPSELTYRFARFSTDTFGVTDYQMTEFAGDTDETSAALVYLGGDGLIHILGAGLGDVSMSDPIQDIFTNYLAGLQSTFSLVRMHNITIGGLKLLLVSIPPSFGNQGLPTGAILIYDFLKKIWTIHAVGNGAPQYYSAFESVYQASMTLVAGQTAVAPVDLVMGTQGFVHSWLRTPFEVNMIQPSVAQLWIGPLSGGEKKPKLQLNFVRIYCNAATNQQVGSSASWTIGISTNEATLLPSNYPTYTPFVNPDVQYQLQPPGCQPIDDPNAKELIVALPNISHPTQAAGDQQIGWRFNIVVNFPTSRFPVEQIGGQNMNVPYDLYAVDVCFTDLNDGKDVNP